MFSTKFRNLEILGYQDDYFESKAISHVLGKV